MLVRSVELNMMVVISKECPCAAGAVRDRKGKRRRGILWTEQKGVTKSERDDRHRVTC
jgi:hypothetical protein